MQIDQSRQRAICSLLSVAVGILFFAAPIAVAGEALKKKEGDTISSFSRWVIAADYAADGSLLVTAGGESLLYRPGDVVVWKSDGSRVGELSGHPTAVWAVDVSSDGKLAATAGYDGLVKVWDLQSRKLKADLLDLYFFNYVRHMRSNIENLGKIRILYMKTIDNATHT